MQSIKKNPNLKIEASIEQNMQIASRAIGSKICIATKEVLHLINLHDILYIKAESSYCTITTFDGTTIFCSKPMSFYFEKLKLIPYFKRVHHSYVVNALHIEKWHHEDGIKLNGSHINIPVARRKRPEIRAFLESISIG